MFNLARKTLRTKGYITYYEKNRVRKSIDFALVSLATAYKKNGSVIEDMRMVFGGVAPIPVKATWVEELLNGKELNAELIAKAAELSVKDALPFEKNKYKVHFLKTMVARFLESIA